MVNLRNMKKEHMIYIAAGLIVIIGVIAYILLNSGGCALCGQPVSATYLQQLYRVANNNTLANNVGSGAAISGAFSNIPKYVNATPLSLNGKPEVLYVGGDFCPYCAVTRWGLIIALMRFGNFTSLTYMESDPRDVYPNTPTFSFSNYSYSSKLLRFQGVEISDRRQQNITTANYTQEDKFLYGRFSGNGIPFIDFENGSIQSGAVVSPGLLRGYNWNQILANLSNQNSPVAQAVIGNANIFTAFMCKSNATLNAGAAACKQPYIKSITG